MMTVWSVRIGLIMLCLSTVWPEAARAQAGQPPARDEAGARDVPAERAATPGIVIRRVQATVRDDVYYLDADIDYGLSRQMLEALDRGVPIPVVLALEILRKRQYLWDETSATLEQRYELDYHSLTRQYMIRNINIGTHTAYPSRAAALSALGRISELPVIDANLLEEGEVYTGRLQARIDINALPVPLRLRALVTPEWRLSSEWQAWRF